MPKPTKTLQGMKSCFFFSKIVYLLNYSVDVVKINKHNFAVGNILTIHSSYFRQVTPNLHIYSSRAKMSKYIAKILLICILKISL